MTSSSQVRKRGHLEITLESFGFYMDALPTGVRHQLIRPEILAMYSWLDQESDEHGESTQYIAWRGQSLEELDATESKDCLWDFVRCVDAPLLDLFDFVQRWGVLEDAGTFNASGQVTVADFRAEARRLRSVLMALVTTEGREIVPEFVLDDLAKMTDFDLYRQEDGDEILRRLGIAAEHQDYVPDGIILPVAFDIRRERWRAIRQAGHGLELQAALVVHLLESFVGADTGSFVWDSAGRRVERVARGVRAIAWSHIAALFSMPLIDIFICAMCGKPFEFDPAVARRRPRQGSKRYCSADCRLEAKRESNRQSWIKNSERWRPARSRRIKNGTQG